MALARVVTFEGVSKDRMEQLKQEMSSGEAPEGFPSAELLVLYDPDTESSTVVVIFENEDDYRTGDEILNNMDAGDTPGERTSVKKHDVAIRMSN
jgi:heme-degrading monooxygenase HmoA